MKDKTIVSSYLPPPLLPHLVCLRYGRGTGIERFVRYYKQICSKKHLQCNLHDSVAVTYKRGGGGQGDHKIIEGAQFFTLIKGGGIILGSLFITSTVIEFKKF